MAKFRRTELLHIFGGKPALMLSTLSRKEPKMLIRLHIQNLAIAENVCVSLSSGLNIITGETGAGKSLLVDGLALLRGGKVETSLIRDGTDSASVSGTFKPPDGSVVWQLLETYGCLRDPETPDEVSVRRVISRTGKHRTYINDTQVSTRILQDVSSELIDISSQFDNQKLLNPETHTLYLDEFAETTELRHSFAEAWQSAWAHAATIDRIEKELALQKREQDLCQFELNQIDQADVRDDEWQRVQRVVTLGQKAAQAGRLINDLKHILLDSDHSFMSQLSMCKKSVERLSKLSGSETLPITAEKVDEISAHLEELAQQLDATEDVFRIDEQELQEAFTRAEIYNTLLQKFGPNLDDIRAHREHCLQKISQSDALHDTLLQVRQDLKKEAVRAITLAGELSKRRRSATRALSSSIEKALAELGMPRTQFVCDLQSTGSTTSPRFLSPAAAENLNEEQLEGFLKLSRSGAERAQFMMSANAGIAPQPIERVASGGELSRTMLAIKSVLFEDGAVSVFVFDEIDTGISGSIASKVGRKLAEFCSKRQALCITHLAQVACFANCHFIAAKSLKNGKTVAQMKIASAQERVQALAGMVAGEKVTKESLAQAQALLSEAQGEQIR
jgi:DNA repair protein RecN (Recombination protein N)